MVNLSDSVCEVENLTRETQLQISETETEWVAQSSCFPLFNQRPRNSHTVLTISSFIDSNEKEYNSKFAI